MNNFESELVVYSIPADNNVYSIIDEGKTDSYVFVAPEILE